MASMPSAFFVVLFAAVGLSLGSFANVVILRLHKTKGVGGRSRCPRCKKNLRWSDLVPVFSYLWLRGRCRFCHKPISMHYPLVELAGAALFLFALWWYPNQPLPAGLTGIILLTLLVTAIIDIRYQEILDAASLIIGIAAILLVSLSQSHSITSAAVGMLIGGGWFALQWVISRGRWVGSGDIFLALALGLWLGMRNTIAMLVLAYAIGSLCAVVLLLCNRIAVRNTRLPFAPFLAIGAVLAFAGIADIYMALLY